MTAGAIEPMDERFNAMLCGFRASGGLARDGEVAARVVARHPGGFVWLARQIAHRRLLFFSWDETPWFPMFQFEPADMSLRHGVVRVAVELVGWTDDWERTDWFLWPHGPLGRRAPIALVDTQPQRLVEAARMERFLHNG